MARTLTLAAFDAWLAALPDDVLVGDVGHCSTCPLAVYLADHDYHNPLVSSRSIDYFRAGVRHWRATPAWARAFIGRVDRGHSVGSHVTAAQARGHLADVREYYG